MDLLEYADTLGFDGGGVNEHHQNGYGIMPSPTIISAGLARRTKDAAMVVLGYSIALYNPPVRVAEEFAMLDCISGGRLVAGFPVGTSMDTNYCYGQIPSLTREKYQEAHDLIIKAWTTREPFAFNGRYNKLRHVNIWPRPIQQPHPPVHIPGGGSVETYDFCIDNTYSYSYLSFSGYLRAQALMNGALGSGSRSAASTRAPIARALPRRSWLRIRTKKPSGSMPSTSATSTTAACTSIRVSPTRRATGRPGRRSGDRGACGPIRPAARWLVRSSPGRS